MPRSFLIVDDDERIRRSLFDALDGPAVSVTTAPSAEAALQVIAEADPDIALVDVRMPGMDGLELLRLLRERSPDVAVIIMSAHEDLPTVAAAMRDGAVDFLVKPLDLHQVRDVIAKIPRRRSGQRVSVEQEDVAEGGPAGTEIIGHTPGMIEVFKRVGQAAGVSIGSEHLSLGRDRSRESTNLGSLEEAEQQHLRRVLKAVDGRKTRASKVLGVSRTRLDRLIKKYGLEELAPGRGRRS